MRIGVKLIKKYNTVKSKMKIKDDDDVDTEIVTVGDTEPVITVIDTDTTLSNLVVSHKDIDNYGIIRNTEYKGKRTDKGKDGKYYVDGKVYNKLFGTIQEVWDEKAYKTSASH